MQEIQWHRGTFHTFFANMKIRVGGASGGDPIDLYEGDEFEYDGSICKYAGREFPQPGLRSAYREGWISTGSKGNVPVAKVAQRDIAKAQTKNTDLSRVQRHGRQQLDQDYLDEETVLDVADRKQVRDAVTGRGHLSSNHNRRTASGTAGTQGLAFNMSEIDEQEGIEISKIRSPKKLKVDVVANPGAAEQIKNRGVEQGYGRYNGKKREPNIINREGVTIKTNVGSVDPEVQYGDESSGEVVGRVRHTDRRGSTEGVSIEDTSSRNQPRQATPKVVAPKKSAPKLPSDASPKLRMAYRLCDQFPLDWNFFGKAEDNIKKIKKIGASPSLLDAMYATASPPFRKALEQTFKGHFG